MSFRLLRDLLLTMPIGEYKIFYVLVYLHDHVRLQTFSARDSVQVLQIIAAIS